VVSELLKPSCDILVGLVLANVIYEEGTDSSTIIGRGDGAIPLLAGGIPDLGLDCLGVDLDGPSGELNADGRLRVQVELVSGESTQQVGFSDAGVSDQHHCSKKWVSASSGTRGRIGKDSGRSGRWEPMGSHRTGAPLKRNCQVVTD